MANVIEYPVKTSEWGKALINTLNPIFDRLEKLIDDVNHNTNAQFKTFKEEFNNKVDDLKVTATSALTLAQQNEQKIESKSNKMDTLEKRCEKLSADNKIINLKNDRLEFTCAELTSENNSLKQHTENLDNNSRGYQRNNRTTAGVEY